MDLFHYTDVDACNSIKSVVSRSYNQPCFVLNEGAEGVVWATTIPPDRMWGRFGILWFILIGAGVHWTVESGMFPKFFRRADHGFQVIDPTKFERPSIKVLGETAIIKFLFPQRYHRGKVPVYAKCLREGCN